MSLCINPQCRKPKNDNNHLFCQSCGSELLLQGLYRVHRELGGGGFGKTYEVAEGNTLKVLKILNVNHPDALRLFKQEAEVLGKLNYPGIPKVEADGYFEFLPRGSQNPIHCFVMEKIEGENLETYLEKRGQAIDQKLALKWLIEIAEILHQVHGQGFLHRDIKPANIMLRPDGQLVLIDFGTVKEITATVMASKTKKQGTGVYTPGYAPPEQEKGSTVPQSDFFALGRSFIHLLTNKYPLDFYNLDTDDLEWRGAAGDLSPLLGDFLDQLMQRLAKERPKDTGVILQRLREIENKLYPPLPSKVPGTKVGLKPNYKRIGLIGGGVVLLGLGGTQFYGYVRYGLFPVNPSYLITGLPSNILFQNPKFNLQKTLKGHSAWVKSVAISSDGQTLVSGSDDNTIKIWDLATGQLKSTLTGHSDWVWSVVISPDGQTLVSGSRDKTIKIWDLATGQLKSTLTGHSDWVWSVAISPDGQIVSGSEDGTIKIWDLATGQLKSTLTGHSAPVWSVAISPDGQTLVSGDGFIFLRNKTIKIWDLATGQLKRTLTSNFYGIWDVAISPDGQTLISGSGDTIKIWDLATGQLKSTLTGHSDPVKSVAISPDGQTLASGSYDKTIKIWDLATGQLKRTLTGHSNSVWSVAISPDGQTIVSGSLDNTIKIWRLER